MRRIRVQRYGSASRTTSQSAYHVPASLNRGRIPSKACFEWETEHGYDSRRRISSCPSDLARILHVRERRRLPLHSNPHFVRLSRLRGSIHIPIPQPSRRLHCHDRVRMEQNRRLQDRCRICSGTIAGSIVGVLMSSRIPTNVVLAILAIFLAFAGTRLILMGRKKTGAKKTERRAIGIVVAAIIVLYSFLVGVLSSLIGIGGAHHFPIPRTLHAAQCTAGCGR